MLPRHVIEAVGCVAKCCLIMLSRRLGVWLVCGGEGAGPVCWWVHGCMHPWVCVWGVVCIFLGMISELVRVHAGTQASDTQSPLFSCCMAWTRS